MASVERFGTVIVGAGPSGLAVAHALLHEAGTDDFVVLEASGGVGGVWRGGGDGLAWEGMATNLSKDKCEFHALPHDAVARRHGAAKAPDFPKAHDMARYFDAFADDFGIRPRIRFHAPVCAAERQERGGWIVKYNGHQHQRTVHAQYLVVCTNVWSSAHIPADVRAFADRTCARLWHAGDLRGLIARRPGDDAAVTPEKKKRVAIVGATFSGPDIASTLARRDDVESVTLVARSRQWYLTRWVVRDKNADPANNRLSGGWRFMTWDTAIAAGIPEADIHPWDRVQELRNATLDAIEEPYADPPRSHTLRNRWGAECLQRIYVDDAAKAALHAPEPERDRSYFSFSDTFADDVLRKRVRLLEAPSIDAAASELGECTDVVAATGYRAGIPFLDRRLLEACAEYDPSDSSVPLVLFKGTLPMLGPQHHRDLAFVGCVRGIYLHTIEQQARWVAALITKRVAWPSPNEDRVKKLMECERALRREAAEGVGFQFPHSNLMGFTDSIAAEFGCRPPLATDPAGAALIGTPLTAAHYHVRPFPPAAAADHSDVAAGQQPVAKL